MGFKGILVSKSMPQHIIDDHPGPIITWDFMSNAAFVVPQGIKKVVVSAYVEYGNYRGAVYSRSMKILKGASIAAQASTTDKNIPYLYCETGLIPIMVGESFKVQTEIDGDGMDVTTASRFLIQIIE
jgi:hypothetical protein